MNERDEGEATARSRTSDLFERIRQDIICGHHEPGKKLKIEALREHYSSGATPVREALSLLAADGLVAREHQRGFRVAGVSTSEFEELLAIRCFIEGRALSLAIERGGEEWEDEIVIARHRLHGRTSWQAAGEESDWEHHHKKFHMALISACGSRTLLRLSDQLYDQNSRYRHTARLKGGARPAIYKEHDRIAEAVLARNSELAVRLLEAHYRTTGELLSEALEKISVAAGGQNPGGASEARKGKAASGAARAASRSS